ncbi:MAG: ABC transporter permease [Brevinema sp.]
MMKLIKLELRRNNLKPYLWGSLGIFIFAVAMGVFFSALPLIEPNDPTSKEMSDFTMLSSLVSIIVMSSYAILSAVMHTKFIVEEYTGRKNVLLFTYPQKRSQILTAKFILTFVFTFTALMISNVVALLLVGFIGNITGLITNPIDVTSIVNILLLSIILGFIANLISIIALRVGFFKKSIIWTIVTAIILVSLFGNSVSLFSNLLLPIFLAAGVVLMVICLILFIGLLKKVDKMECL